MKRGRRPAQGLTSRNITKICKYIERHRQPSGRQRARVEVGRTFERGSQNRGNEGGRESEDKAAAGEGEGRDREREREKQREPEREREISRAGRRPIERLKNSLACFVPNLYSRILLSHPPPPPCPALSSERTSASVSGTIP